MRIDPGISPKGNNLQKSVTVVIKLGLKNGVHVIIFRYG